MKKKIAISAGDRDFGIVIVATVNRSDVLTSTEKDMFTDRIADKLLKAVLKLGYPARGVRVR